MQHRLETLRNRVRLMFLIGGVEGPELREHLDELHDLRESMADMARDMVLDPQSAEASRA